MLPVPLNSGFIERRTLAELRVGQAAEVADVVGADAMAVRLLEMGLVPGVRVEVRKFAPLGDPMEVRVRGYHMSVRRLEARRVVLASGSGPDRGDDT